MSFTQFFSCKLKSISETDQTSYRAAVPTGVSSGIHMVLEMRDGGKSKLLDKGLRKAMVNINGIITHRLCCIWMSGNRQKPTSRRSRLLMEPRTSGVWSIVQRGANATVAVPTRLCCAGAAASEVSLYTYISTLSGKPTNKCMMPVLSFAVISGGSHAGTCLACLEFMIVPTGSR